MTGARTTGGEDSASARSADCYALLRTAIEKLKQGDAQAALHAASEACHCAPQEPKAHYAYGQAWLALNDPVRAERAFADAITHDPAWADAWINYGVARYRQGHVEDAKRAMREALARQPDHPAAAANLEAFMRASGGAARLTAWKPEQPAVSLGLAVEYLMKKSAFAKLPFGEWSQVLIGQINRGHFFFVLDAERRVCGFFGWSLADERLAEEWVEGRRNLSERDCLAGDCVIINAWAADTARVHRFIVNEGRKLFDGKRRFYAKRHYPDGRTRPTRFAATDFLATHAVRAAAEQSDPKPR
jgi:hemolysin-activating ACP:hemolysin acyltransferase